MKKQFQHLNLFLAALLLLTALSSTAQQQFIHTATKANISCNGDCTQLDIPELNNNPDAILFVTPILDGGVNLNPHLIGVYYFNKKWNIFNLDQKALPAGSKFNVQYSVKPDATHFKYSITNENIRKDGSAYIDHPALANNSAIQFVLFPSWIPIDGGAANRYEIKTQFDPDARKWFIKNINERYLYARVAYNIIISNQGNSVAGIVKGNPDISIKNPTIITKPTGIIIPDYDKPVVKPNATGIIIPDIDKPVVKPNATGIIITDIDKPLDKKDIITKTSIPPSYDFSNIKICIDKATNKSLPPKPPFIPYPVIPKIKSNGELEPVSTVTQSLSGVTNLMWWPGAEIRVGFFPYNNYNDADLKRIRIIVSDYVKEWETYANVKFNFNYDVSASNIKIGFSDDNISWSWVGREVLVNPNNEKTMNFGSLNFYSQDYKLRRTILHEFGHALGFIHEHQSPEANIAWDTAKVYAFFNILDNGARAQGRDGIIIGAPVTSKVDSAIFNKFSTTSNNSSTYDKQSIMHYFYPPELTKDGTSFYYNYQLSNLDQAFARQVYPFPPSPPNSTGVLLTGDDCDEIEFTIEYNVVHSSEVEFILKAGYDSHNNYALVNWWKMIGIPLVHFPTFTLELNNNIKLQANEIDKRYPITFGKAKVLGVHTGLAYTWPVLPAIIGGCRVKLVWRRDRCN